MSCLEDFKEAKVSNRSASGRAVALHSETGILEKERNEMKLERQSYVSFQADVYGM